MALRKSTRLALRALTAFDVDVKRTYRAERRIEKLLARLQGKPSDYRIWDWRFFNGEAPVPVRMFSPPGEGPFPVLLFFHGGGWVTGGIHNYTGVCVDLAKATGHMVGSVDYRLAPEHRFPAGLEDCYAVAREFYLGHVPGVKPGAITLMGDSAGGNLAAAVSLLARDRGEFLPHRQILVYPATNNDHSEQSPFLSVRENGEGFLLTAKRIRDVLELYQGSPEDRKSPYLAPLLAKDFSGQPRTLVITAEYCPLRDEGEAYGMALWAAGNDVRIVRIPNAVHAFLMLPAWAEHVKQAHGAICDFLWEGSGNEATR